MLMTGFPIQHLLVFVVVYADFAYSHIDHYITPSSNEGVCPQQPCLSLSQLTANSSRYLGNETNISLFFLPGNHSLNEELSLSHVDNLSITKDIGGNGTVFIECGNPSGRFNISETKSVTIKNLHFIGCGSNRVNQVEELIVEDTTFQGVEGKGTEIVLNNVITACITGSVFHSNTHVNDYRDTGVGLFHAGRYNKIYVGGRALYIVSSNNASIVNCKFISVTAIAGNIFDQQKSDVLFVSGGALYMVFSNILIVNSIFTQNAAEIGGALFAHHSSLHVVGSNYSYNTAYYGGVLGTFDSTVNIINSNFNNNAAEFHGGVMIAYYSNYNISGTTIAKNYADISGGVTDTLYSKFVITDSTFNDNTANLRGGVISASFCFFSIGRNNLFTNNSANFGGVIVSYDDPTITSFSKSINITNSTFINNSGGGFIVCFLCSAYVANSVFDHNSGSLYIFNGNLTFSGYIVFENSAEPLHNSQLQEGGAITSFLSRVTFIGVSNLSNNHGQHGGAILAVESTIIMYGSTTIANNMAMKNVMNSSGGGISLQQSKLEIKGKCNINDNHAMRGGGIHASDSTIAVIQPGTLYLINNTAENGGGLYLEANPKVYILKPRIGRHYNTDIIVFRDNHANYGGAIYVADDTNSGACLSKSECFIQTLILDPENSMQNTDIVFSDNTASQLQGANIFGGLLDRCVLNPGPLAEAFLMHERGDNYLINKSIALDTISSLPVRVCFCESESEPNCSYQLPTIKVKRGEGFNVSLVAVDQVNRSVNANISSILSSQDGGFNEGQQIQDVGRSCTNLMFNVFSPYSTEILNIYADGPCGQYPLSVQQVHIQFTNCTCPVGFEPIDSETRCECICDSELFPYITKCNFITESIVRVNTTSWITYINDTHQPGYIIHPYCPFDYCKSPTENFTMNLNLPNGSDKQCAYNRTGILCGACKINYSLSLGSSRCLPCQSHWPSVLVAILLVAIIAGILLVTALLALNMTVAVGMTNGFIFYANIVAANSAVFFPSSEPSFPTVFIAWLNLDIGIDVCFFDGLDAYYKTWLQLAFPAYIIFLVILIIIVSEYSPRFAGLIGKRDPIATLATLILLSYAKLLSVSITALLPATINYPNGTQQTAWFPDGNVQYFLGKHSALVIVAIIIILIGIPYTSLLFLWQWLVRTPQWKIFKWTRNTKLSAFISVHHAPYNAKYRYWTGLLLLVRVVLFTVALGTKSIEPQVSLLMTIISVGGLLSLKTTGVTVYKSVPVDVVETILCFNLLAFATFSFFRFKDDMKKQMVVAYISTIITLILLVGAIIYHVFLLVRKDERPKEEDGIPLAPVQPANAEITCSVVELPKPCDESSPPQADSNKVTVTY